MSHALSTAEVFVPLYSPGYFARSWPGREWASFERRMTDSGVQNPLERFAPVLWIPLPPGHDETGLTEALELGAGQDGYAENGLRRCSGSTLTVPLTPRSSGVSPGA